MTLYMMTTEDKYELPLAVGDSPRELAEMTGASAKVISQSICRRKSYNRKGDTKRHPKWHKVEIDEV